MLTESTSIDVIEVLESGILQIREATIINRDGEFLSKSYHRYCLIPGASVDGQPQRVVDIASAVWTPEVISAFNNAA